MRQLGLAVAAFEMTHRELPVSSGFFVNQREGIEEFLGSIFLQMAPQLEILVSNDHLISRGGRTLYEAGVDSVDVLTCPSDPGSAGVSYRGNVGANYLSFQTGSERHDRFLGPFETPHAVRLRDVADGLS